MPSSSIPEDKYMSAFRGYFFSQPHQPFFTAGIITAIVLMLMFGLAYKGVFSLSVPTLMFHAYGLVFVTFSQFFIGFLFTTFPRFCQSEVIDKRTYISVFLLYQTGALLFMMGAFTAQSLVIVGVLILFLAHLGALLVLQRIYNGSNPALRTDPFWIMTAFYFGIVSHALWMIAYALGLFDISFEWLIALATSMAMNMYLILLVFAVAQRMVPFFSHSFEPKDPHLGKIVFIGIVIKTFLALMQWQVPESVLDVLLGLYILREFISWKLPVFSSLAILWVLHLALFWLPGALILGGVFELLGWRMESSFASLQTHLLALGVLTTILIGFGTRVTLGHSGQPPEADKIAKGLFWMTQVLLLSRLLYSLNSGLGLSAFWLFDLSLTLWVVLFGIWSWRYGPILVRGKKSD